VAHVSGQLGPTDSREIFRERRFGHMRRPLNRQASRGQLILQTRVAEPHTAIVRPPFALGVRPAMPEQRKTVRFSLSIHSQFDRKSTHNPLCGR